MDGVSDDEYEREAIIAAWHLHRTLDPYRSIDFAVADMISDRDRAMQFIADRRAQEAYSRGFNDGTRAGPLAAADASSVVTDEMVKAFMSVYWRMAVAQYVEWRKHGLAPAPMVSSDHVRAGLEAVERMRVENAKP